jgi:hypothetical protein
VQSQSAQLSSLQTTNNYLFFGTVAGGVLDLGVAATSILGYTQLLAYSALNTSISSVGNVLFQLNTAALNLSQGITNQGNLITNQSGTLQWLNCSTNNLTSTVANQNYPIGNASSNITQYNISATTLNNSVVNQSNVVNALLTFVNTLISNVGGHFSAIGQEAYYNALQSLSIWSVNSSYQQNQQNYLNNTLMSMVDDALHNSQDTPYSYNMVYDTNVLPFNRTNFLNTLNGLQQTITLIFTNHGYVIGAGLAASWTNATGNITDTGAFTFSVSNGGVCPIIPAQNLSAVSISPNYMFQFGNGEITVWDTTQNGSAANNLTYSPKLPYPSGVTNTTYYESYPTFGVVRIVVFQYFYIGEKKVEKKSFDEKGTKFVKRFKGLRNK